LNIEEFGIEFAFSTTAATITTTTTTKTIQTINYVSVDHLFCSLEKTLKVFLSNYFSLLIPNLVGKKKTKQKDIYHKINVF
jgi:hypothetical protein